MVDLTKEHEDTKRKEEENHARIEKHNKFWDEVNKDMENAIFNHMEDLVGESMRGDYPYFKLSIFPPSMEDGKIDVGLLCVLIMIRKEGGVLDTSISPKYRMVYHVKKKKLEVPRKSECLWRVHYNTKWNTLRKILAIVITPYWDKTFKRYREVENHV